MVFGCDRTLSVYCCIGGGLASWKEGSLPYDFLDFSSKYGTITDCFCQRPIGSGISVFRSIQYRPRQISVWHYFEECNHLL